MSLVINLTPTEEARLSEVAMQIGLAPEEWIGKLVREHLPVNTISAQTDVDARLRQWQKQDGVKLMPDRSASELSALWTEEDAKMTDKEREAEDRLWEEIQKGINGTRAALGMRQL